MKSGVEAILANVAMMALMAGVAGCRKSKAVAAEEAPPQRRVVPISEKSSLMNSLWFVHAESTEAASE